jgi:hypothetical protein
MAATPAETFSAPLESVIAALGRGVAEAQAALDRSSLRAQEEIDGDPELSRIGAQATWFQLPRVDLELKVSMTVVQDAKPQIAAGPGRLVAANPARLVAQPVSAKFQNHFDYRTEASSLVRLSIVPVPPPRAGDEVTAPPKLTRDAVQEAALKSPTKFRAAKGRPNPKLRFDVNFNAASRTWYVLQYDPANPAAAARVVAVDDETGAVREISG